MPGSGRRLPGRVGTCARRRPAAGRRLRVDLAGPGAARRSSRGRRCRWSASGHGKGARSSPRPDVAVTWPPSCGREVDGPHRHRSGVDGHAPGSALNEVPCGRHRASIATGGLSASGVQGQWRPRRRAEPDAVTPGARIAPTASPAGVAPGAAGRDGYMGQSGAVGLESVSSSPDAGARRTPAQSLAARSRWRPRRARRGAAEASGRARRPRSGHRPSRFICRSRGAGSAGGNILGGRCCGSSSPTTTGSAPRGCRRCGARCSRSTASSSRWSRPTPTARRRRARSRRAGRCGSRRSTSATARVGYATDGTPVDCVRLARSGWSRASSPT